MSDQIVASSAAYTKDLTPSELMLLLSLTYVSVSPNQASSSQAVYRNLSHVFYVLGGTARG